MLYFICLGVALFLTKYFVDQRIAFWYYVLMTMSVSYNLVVEFLPSVKALYVAAAISAPILIVAKSYPDEKRLLLVAFAAFFVALGRELCMDIEDRNGDVSSLIHRIPSHPLAIAAFIAQSVGLTLLLIQVRSQSDLLVAILMALGLTISGFFWFGLTKHKAAIRLMKLQFLVGLYFLF